MKVHTLRVLLAAVLALMAALVIVYAMLSLRAYFSDGSHAAPEKQAYSDQEKLAILQSLKSTSTQSATNSKKILHSLSASSSVNMDEQAKLDILKALQSK